MSHCRDTAFPAPNAAQADLLGSSSRLTRFVLRQRDRLKTAASFDAEIFFGVSAAYDPRPRSPLMRQFDLRSTVLNYSTASRGDIDRQQEAYFRREAFKFAQIHKTATRRRFQCFAKPRAIVRLIVVAVHANARRHASLEPTGLTVRREVGTRFATQRLAISTPSAKHYVHYRRRDTSNVALAFECDDTTMQHRKFMVLY